MKISNNNNNVFVFKTVTFTILYSFYANLDRTIKTLNTCDIKLRKKKGKGKKYNNVQKETPNIYLSTRFLLFENRQKYTY